MFISLLPYHSLLRSRWIWNWPGQAEVNTSGGPRQAICEVCSLRTVELLHDGTKVRAAPGRLPRPSGPTLRSGRARAWLHWRRSSWHTWRTWPKIFCLRTSSNWKIESSICCWWTFTAEPFSDGRIGPTRQILSCFGRKRQPKQS